MPDLDAALQLQIEPFVRGDAIALMLYGSIARGDGNASSDVDVLQVVPFGGGAETHGRLSLVSYGLEQIEAMVAKRSLFAWHLRTEGRLLMDTDRTLECALNRHLGPDFQATIERVRTLGAILDVEIEEFRSSSDSLVNVARYLLRTATYSIAMTAGCTSFAIDQAAMFTPLGSEVRRLLRRAPKSDRHNTWADFCSIRDALALLVGSLCRNPYGGLQALAVRSAVDDPPLCALAVHAMSGSGDELDYTTFDVTVL